MTPLRPTNIRIDSELLDAMQTLLERDGISVSEQVRRAIRMWLETKGVKVKAATRRAGTRRKA
jgi:Arc/MetJ-type ribon-helix-helix transcriptional regulator